MFLQKKTYRIFHKNITQCRKSKTAIKKGGKTRYSHCAQDYSEFRWEYYFSRN